MNKDLLFICVCGFMTSVAVILIGNKVERIELRVTRLELLNTPRNIGERSIEPPFKLICKSPLKSGIVTEDEKIKHGCYYDFPVLHIDTPMRKP